MTLIEAVATSQFFRLCSEDEFGEIMETPYIKFNEGKWEDKNENLFWPTKDMILSEEWEIEKEAVVIDIDSVREAVVRAYLHCAKQELLSDPDNLADQVCKNLGFDPEEYEYGEV